MWILLVLFGLFVFEVDSQQNLKHSLFKKFGSALLGGSIFLTPSYSFADTSLTEQLRSYRTAQESSTKTRIETDESEAISRALKYPDGYLVGRALVSLVTDAGYSGPYGVPESYLVNPDLGKDEATMILLAVGRDGPPLAAKKIASLNTLKFPLIVEITCEDLLFPYTSSAWLSSSNKLDSMALTVVLSSDGKLSTAAPSDRIGLGLSELANIAGVTTRTTANIATTQRIDLSLYSKEDIELLTGIDAALDRRTSKSK